MEHGPSTNSELSRLIYLAYLPVKMALAI